MKIEEQALIKEAQRGSIPAYEALVRQYDRQVMQLALNLTGHVQDAEDIYQEVFVRIFRKLPGFDFRSEFSTWLFRVTVNTGINFQKKKQRRQRWLGSPIAPAEEDNLQDKVSASGQTPEQLTLNRELADKIDSALLHLSSKQRTVFVMRYYQDYKLVEIADILDCSLGTVKNYLFRATRKLRQLLHAYSTI